MSVDYILSVDLELDICVVRVVYHFRKVNGVMVGRFGDVEGVDVDAVEVVVEGAVEASEDKEEAADEGGGVAASGGWAGLTGE